MKLPAAAFLLLGAMSPAAADDQATAGDNLIWCGNNPKSCRYYIGGIIEGLQAGAMIQADEADSSKSIGCPAGGLTYVSLADIAIAQLRQPESEKYLHMTLGFAVSIVLQKTFPCGEGL